MLNTSIQWLTLLINENSLPASSLPRAAKSDIENLIFISIIEKKRAGAGSRYYCVDNIALRKIVLANTYDGDISRLTVKARAVAMHGDAHKGQDDSILLMLAATEEGPLWSDNESTLNVFDYSSRFGVASLVVKKGDNWSTNKPIALIENLDLLIYAREYFENIDFTGTVLYYSGMISGKLLDWLSEKNRGTEYIMFPDYDIVGLNNYIRAKDRLGGILSMYVPPDLRSLIKHGDKNTLMNSKASRAAIESTHYKEVIEVYKTLLEEGKTLHQEALML